MFNCLLACQEDMADGIMAHKTRGYLKNKGTKFSVEIILQVGFTRLICSFGRYVDAVLQDIPVCLCHSQGKTLGHESTEHSSL